MQYPEIKFLDPGPKPADGQPVLKRHPLNSKLMPEPVLHSAEWGAFKVGLSAAGPERIPPLLITKDGQIVDGKRRWLAARELQWTKLPCLICDEAEAALVIIDSFCGQRSLDLGAKAYISISGERDYIKAAEHRRLGNLRRGSKTIEKPLIFSNHNPCGSANPEYADRIGVSFRTLEDAASVYRLFYDPKCDGWQAFYNNFPGLCPKLEVLKQYQAEKRAEMEPEILSGARTIWQVRQAIAGWLPEMQARKGAGPVANAQLELWDSTFESVTKAASAWEKLDTDSQESVLKSWRRTFKKMPESLLAALRLELQEVAA